MPPFPQKRPPALDDYDAIMRDAKLSLTGDQPWDQPTPVVSPVAPTPAAPVDDSLWGKIKRVANYSPIREDIGADFQRSGQQVRDQKALHGEELSPVDKVAAFLEPSIGFGLDAIRSTATPAGLANLASPTSALGRTLQGGASAVYGGEGLEQATDSKLSTGQRVMGGVNALLSTLGLHSAVSGPKIPALPEGFDELNKVIHEPGPMLSEPPAAPAPAAPPPPTRHPVDLFDTPEFHTPKAAPTALEEIAPQTAQAAQAPPPPPSTPAPPAPEPVAPVPEPVSVPSGRPKLAAQDVSDMLAGREKFAAQNPGVEPLPGMRDELDRSGVEYNRTQRTLKQLLGMPDADPAEVGRMKQGARELGARLRTTAQDALPPKPLPPLPDGFEALNGELGDLNAPPPAPSIAPPGREGHFNLPEPTAKLDDRGLDRMLEGTDARVERRRAKVNGEAPPPVERRAAPEPPPAEPTGGELIQDPREPPRYWAGNERGEVSPDLLKFLARPAAGAAIGGVFGDPDHRERDMAIGAGLGVGSHFVSPERLRYASMLTGMAQAKNIVGDLGVVGNTAAERAITHGPGQGLEVLKQFFSPETAKDYMRVVKGETETGLNRLDRPESASTEGLMGLPFRTMGAADDATVRAMERAGVHDASERTFTADPKTDLGTAAMQLQRKGGSAARFLIPFMKTAVNETEAAILPFTHLNDADPAVRKAAQAKVALLMASGGAGAAFGTTDTAKEHPRLAALLSTLAGPGQVPFALGTAASLAKGTRPLDKLKAIMQGVMQQIPAPSEWALDPQQIAKSLAPAGLDLINPDDVKRDTSGGIWDALLSRIPGLSSSLPAKGGKHRSHQSLLNE